MIAHLFGSAERRLPRSWTADPARCKAARIPGGIRFAANPRLARRMITRALGAGTPAGWVAGDEVYGGDPGLRAGLERRRAGYVLAVADMPSPPKVRQSRTFHKPMTRPSPAGDPSCHWMAPDDGRAR